MLSWIHNKQMTHLFHIIIIIDNTPSDPNYNKKIGDFFALI